MSFFSHASAAQRYAASRPYFHPIVIERIQRFLGRERIRAALDVACGTGQSTRALLAMAEWVLAVDQSEDMLAQAPELPGVQYVRGSAEALPARREAFDLVTVSLAFHWFDQDRFLSEARRVLRPGGWLVLYNNGFTGAMRENPEFVRWSRDIYLNRYPSPPRHQYPMTAEWAQQRGFRLAGREPFTNEVVMTPEELTAYLLTQSNVIAAVEQGSEALPEVAASLLREITPFFHSETGTMQFTGEIWYLRREAADPDRARRNENVPS